MTAGLYSSVWDGRTNGGVPASTGVYLYRLQAMRLDDSASGGADSFIETRKMLLLK
jgi:hypothetical protein